MVTLSGPIRDQRMRQEAVAIAQTTDGVHAVVDRMWRQGETAATTGEEAESPVPDPAK
jgi:BON domain-containing protein